MITAKVVRIVSRDERGLGLVDAGREVVVPAKAAGCSGIVVVVLLSHARMEDARSVALVLTNGDVMQTKWMPNESDLKVLREIAVAGGTHVTTQTLVNRRAFDDWRLPIKQALIGAGLVAFDVSAAPFGDSTATLSDEFWTITPAGIALLAELNAPSE